MLHACISSSVSTVEVGFTLRVGFGFELGVLILRVVLWRLALSHNQESTAAIIQNPAEIEGPSQEKSRVVQVFVVYVQTQITADYCKVLSSLDISVRDFITNFSYNTLNSQYCHMYLLWKSKLPLKLLF